MSMNVNRRLWSKCHVINGEDFTGNVVEQVMPHDHKHVIRVHLAGEKRLRQRLMLH